MGLDEIVMVKCAGILGKLFMINLVMKHKLNTNFNIMNEHETSN